MPNRMEKYSPLRRLRSEFLPILGMSKLEDLEVSIFGSLEGGFGVHEAFFFQAPFEQLQVPVSSTLFTKITFFDVPFMNLRMVRAGSR